MPIYEYVCDDCGRRYERLVLSQTQEVRCPDCSSGRHTLQLSVFSAHSGASGNGASARAGSSWEGGGSCACGAGGCGRQ